MYAFLFKILLFKWGLSALALGSRGISAAVIKGVIIILTMDKAYLNRLKIG